jgi:glycogen operon protein
MLLAEGDCIMHFFHRACLTASLGIAFLCHPVTDGDFLQAASLGDFQYGAHPRADGGVDFSLHAPAAETVELLLYDAPDARTPARVLPMQRNPAGDWSLSVRGLGIGPGAVYLYRLTGHSTATAARPFGTVLNGNFVLNDPYAYRTQEVGYSRVYTSTPFVDTQVSIYAGGGKSIVYDHAADPPIGHVMIRPEDLIVYELHVQDYTARLGSLARELRGTYLGLVQPGLRTPGGLTAGIDHIAELMAVAQYDTETAHTRDRLNHWGYESTNFSAPEARDATTPGAQRDRAQALGAGFPRARDRCVPRCRLQPYCREQLGAGRLAFKCYNLCDDVPEIYRANSAGGFAKDSGTGNDVDFSDGDRFTKQLIRDSLRSGTRPTASLASGAMRPSCSLSARRTPPAG